MPFDVTAKAQQHLAAVKKLGCEARKDNHGGHIDVAYRAGQWKSIEVATEKLAHQWESWLKGLVLPAYFDPGLARGRTSLKHT